MMIAIFPRAKVYAFAYILAFGIPNFTSLAAEEELLQITTGSRLPRAVGEVAEPVYVLSREQIAQEGHGNVYQALLSLNIIGGAVQGEQNPNGFTPNGKEVNIRGLGASRTIVLVNGRRIADSPFPLNGFSSFFNLSLIPTAAIEHIEVSTGASSAIYGSEAVTGVVNIITNSDFKREQATLGLQVGDTEDGGGASRRFSYMDGLGWSKGYLNFGLQFEEVDPIFGADRDYLDGFDDIPETAFYLQNFAAFRLREDFSFAVPGGSSGCADLDDTLFVSEQNGSYCSRNEIGYQTLRNRSSSTALFGHFNHFLDNQWQLFGEFMFSEIDSESRADRLSTGQIATFAKDEGVDVYTNFLRSFSDQEIPDQFSYQEDKHYFSVFGLSRALNERTDLQLSVSASRYDYSEQATQVTEEAAYDFFAGDLSRLWRSLTPAELATISGDSQFSGQSELYGFNALLQSQFETSRGQNLQISALFEYYDQSYELQSDDRSVVPDQLDYGWLRFKGANGSGKREQMSLALEAIFPVLTNSQGDKVIEVQTAMRYDQHRYRDEDNTAIEEITHKFGLTWFPFENILLRSTFSSSFRSPDLQAMYTQSNFFDYVTDETICRQSYLDAFGELPTTTGEEYCFFRDPVFIDKSASYKPRKLSGRSKTVGFVIAPFDGVSLALDYYDLEFENAVVDTGGIQALLLTEADCAFGQDINGKAVNPNSSDCVSAQQQITRVEAGSVFENVLDTITIVPEALNLEQDGIDVSLNLEQDFAFGLVSFDLFYTRVFNATRVPVTIFNRVGELPDPRYFDADNKTKASLFWQNDRWLSGVTLVRTGPIQNYADTARLPSWYTSNVYLSRLFGNASLGVSVNNVQNKKPIKDDTHLIWPFFNNTFYSAAGREYFVNFSYRY